MSLVSFIEDQVSQEDWQSDCSVVQAGYDAFEFMCLSCGVRPGASWLGHDECHECFDEH